MINPYEPIHPDGPVDLDDVPTPMAGTSWLDDDDDATGDWRSHFSLVTEDPA